MTIQEQQNLARELRKQAASLHAQGHTLEKMAEQLEAASAPQKKPDPEPDLRTPEQIEQIRKIMDPKPKPRVIC